MSRWSPYCQLAIVAVILASGCTLSQSQNGLPSKQEVVRDQLVVHSDFHLPKHHRLLDELVARRSDISNQLAIPLSDEPINVYLFQDEETFRDYMVETHPDFPFRRAFFVKDDTRLNVFAFWGSRVGEDLRHEVTHGYVHSVVPNLPLWLDEGIAEYFEVSRGKQGINNPHIYHLSNALIKEQWQPDLARLEAIESAGDLTQRDYAESWLWVHFLLTADASSRDLLRDYLSQLRSVGTALPLAAVIRNEIPDVETRLLAHLERLEAQK